MPHPLFCGLCSSRSAQDRLTRIAPLTATIVVTSAMNRTKAAPPITASGSVAEMPKRTFRNRGTRGVKGRSPDGDTQAGDQHGSRGKQTGHFKRRRTQSQRIPISRLLWAIA
jgi:hypothetical protein